MQRVRETLRAQQHRLKRPVNKRKVALIGGGGVFAVLLLVQFFYPTDRLLPFTNIDGLNVGGAKRTTAITQLNTAYAKHTIDIYGVRYEACDIVKAFDRGYESR